MNDLSRIQGTPLFSLTVSGSQKKGLYRLADGVQNFESALSLPADPGSPPAMLAVGQTADINGIGYSLNLSDNVLTLTAGAAGTPNHADCGWNNSLCENKTPNPKIRDLVPAALTIDTPEILLDTEGSVSKDENGKHNFVGFCDEADFTKITLDHAAKLSFRIEATDAAKFVIYEKGKGSTFTAKSLQTTSLLKKDHFAGTTAAIFLEKGDYYISMQSTNAKKGGGAYYNVFLNTDGDRASRFYADGDDNSNDCLYDSKLKAVNPRATGAGDAELFRVTGIAASGKKQDVLFDDDNEMTLDTSGKYKNFVGWGDDTDFAKLSATQPVRLDFTVTASEKVTMKVYSLTKNTKGNWVMKALQTISYNPAKPATDVGKALYLDRLSATAEAPETGYYVSVTSSNKKGSAYYSVSVDSKVYSDSDLGVNGFLLTDKNTINAKLKSTAITGERTKIATEVCIPETDDISVEARIVGETTYGNFVGFGDEWDYAEVTFSQAGTVKLELDVTGTAKTTSKLVLYKLTLKSNGSWAKNTVGSLSVKTAADGVGSNFKNVKIREGTRATGQAGDIRYFVGVQAGNARKGTEAYYTAYATLESSPGAALGMPETDDLGTADTPSFGQNTDALADASSFGLAEENFLEESGRGILAGL